MSISVLFWIALVALAAPLRRGRWLLAPIAALLLGSSVLSATWAHHDAVARRAARAALLRGGGAGYDSLYPDRAILDERRAILARHRWSSFR